MNQYDSEVAGGLLAHQGFEIMRLHDDEAQPLEPPAKILQNTGEGFGRIPQDFLSADVVLMNTCSVREHAEERVFGRLGILGKIKKTKPELIVGLMGCMVEEHQEKLFKRFPQLDLMVGTRNITELASLIEHVRQTREQVSRIKQDGISIEYTDQIQRHGKFHAWLPIMTGCNKVCTFCIVPVTRGSEVSMPAREVYREASRLVGEGVKWITLLGQNVNSYTGRSPILMIGDRNHLSNLTFERTDVNSYDGSFRHSERSEESQNTEILRPEGLRMTKRTTSFPELLDMLAQIEGLERISFTTSHPSDATEELYRVIAKNPKISRRFHLPLQSGSDKILKRMKRLHTYEEFKSKIDLMREIIPGVSITTDIIAGFSGESEEDHQATARALKEIRFDGAYIYKYSLRAQTRASKLPDDVPINIKERRNAELLEIQRDFSQKANEQLIGQTFEVFVEEISSRDSSRLLGRTAAEKKVVFPGEAALLGTNQKIKLEALRHDTFLGTLAGC
ncbi:MAG: radical SAM protein [Candidatus Omnitrophica bacterium]|nr:radical SAM protein [Candidatus Omnitrophota bacterium]